jgi:hydrogenase maturation protease
MIMYPVGCALERTTCANGALLSAPYKTLVICYGNPLRGDDGFGWHVAEHLIGTRLENLDVITCHQLTPEFAEVIAQSRAVVFVDASLEVHAGKIMVQELEPNLSSINFTHHLVPAQVLAFSHSVYGRVPRAWLITVGALNLEHSEHLSPQVAAAIPKVLEEVQRVLQLR